MDDNCFVSSPILRPQHPDNAFIDIKKIMTMIIKESGEIRMQFLSILINSVKKENQNVSPRSYVLGEEVLQESAVKIHPYLPKAVADLNISFKNYSKVVEYIWRKAMKYKAKVENAPQDLAPHASPKRVVSFLDHT
uniref:Uncharacterized protein n=1 Tax=Solanum lycopersicum TaxID=4081 RepID=A0A3Q7H6N2_SOLLC